MWGIAFWATLVYS